MRRRFWVKFLCSILLASSVFSGQDFDREEAFKVFSLIDQIQTEGMRTPAVKDRKVTVSESELNSYIAYRIEAEREEIMRELRFKFLGKNRIEGKIFIDLKGQNVPRILRPEMTFYFAADVEVKDELVRLKLDELFLEGQEIRPELLDLVILIGSNVAGWQTGGINDWYELPFGIRDIKVYEGFAEFYY